MKSPEGPLPTGIRVATMIALVFGAMVSFGAVRDLPLTVNAGASDMPEVSLGPFKALVKDEKVYLAAMRASFRAQMSAMEAMQTSRVLILAALSTSASLVFISALRLRWPAGARRGSIARLLAGASVATAVLRTLDGAQLLAIARKGVLASEKVLAASGVPELQSPEGVNVAVTSALSVAMTAVTVASFLALGAYFRAARPTQLFATLDRDLPEDDED